MSTTLKLNRPMSKWRKRCGLGMTHMLARKAKAIRLEFHHGAKRSV